MTRKELMNALKANEISYKATMKTEELEKLYNENIKESEKEEMNENKRKYAEFDVLAEILDRNNIKVINETDRRITTANVMFCRRKNKVRAYVKQKTFKQMSNEFTAVADRNTQYIAYIDIILNSYAEQMIKRICEI